MRLLKGDDAKIVIKELAAYLLDGRRTREAELIVRDIEARLLANGTALVTTTSARELSDESKRSIKELVKTEQPGVKDIILREQIDESVIGGVRIELPGKLADFTVKAKLDKLTA
jgi:F-type H+-transporting ATPase subunit delta